MSCIGEKKKGRIQDRQGPSPTLRNPVLDSHCFKHARGQAVRTIVWQHRHACLNDDRPGVHVTDYEMQVCCHGRKSVRQPGHVGRSFENNNFLFFGMPLNMTDDIGRFPGLTENIQRLLDVGRVQR